MGCSHAIQVENSIFTLLSAGNYVAVGELLEFSGRAIAGRSSFNAYVFLLHAQSLFSVRRLQNTHLSILIPFLDGLAQFNVVELILSLPMIRQEFLSYSPLLVQHGTTCLHIHRQCVHLGQLTACLEAAEGNYKRSISQ